MTAVPKPVPGCWIDVVAPDRDELDWLIKTCGIVPEFVMASLDPEETSRIDHDEESKQTLVIADYPDLAEEEGETVTYHTEPVGIILGTDFICTVCLEETVFLGALAGSTADTRLKTRFLLLVLYRISQLYLLYLRQIEKASNQTTSKLYRTMKNRELLHMLSLDKSLIYFSTSLKAEEITLQKIMRGREIPFYEDDRELLEDVQIEFSQASEMCSIYTSINSRTMDGFSNVINNSMNDTMKQLTIITIVMSIPNMIYGFYGMNVTGLPLPVAWFPLVFSVICCIICWKWFSNGKHY